MKPKMANCVDFFDVGGNSPKIGTKNSTGNSTTNNANKNIQVQVQVSSLSPYPILSTHKCRWCLGTAPLGLYTLYSWTGVVQGQSQLRSQDAYLPSAPQIMVTNRKWGIPPTSTILCNSIVFTSLLVSKLCSRSWN